MYKKKKKRERESTEITEITPEPSNDTRIVPVHFKWEKKKKGRR